MADALLAWLVAYLGLLASVGFVLYVVRSASDRQWSNRALLRASSGIAFVLSFVLWLLLSLAG